MESNNQIIIFLLGFFSGGSVIALLYFLFSSKKNFGQKENDDLVSLRDNIKLIQQSLQNFNLAQDRIEKSLIRGGSQQQGAWGEFVLKNILDSAGLREGEEYETQKAYRDNDGNLQKPDVIVHMPGMRDIIIDSKVSLSAWHDYSNTKEENLKSQYLKKFLESVKYFVRDLSKDNYSNLYDINTIDSILMFMPVEPALLALYNEGKKIVEDAWQKKIIIVGPSTLPFLLKAIENMWRIDKQTKQIKDIAFAATDIYEKTVNVYESFNQANQSINKAKIKMDEAKLRLQDGPGSLTKKVQKMKDLGRLSTKKNLPIDSDDNIN
jgi:DNA recombination protein RmuC